MEQSESDFRTIGTYQLNNNNNNNSVDCPQKKLKFLLLFGVNFLKIVLLKNQKKIFFDRLNCKNFLF